jgi:7-carboxy-7-deazaguanine synthase (Cx14CxxC type)
VSYAVKEMLLTLQGEGVHTGRPAVFVRFSGCNLWSGREEDREGAACRFWDRDVVGTDCPGGGVFAAARDLAAAAAALWPGEAGRGGTPFAVCTGGEPFLQMDRALVDALHAEGFEVAVETNGTLPAPPGIDWLCVSPKAGAPLLLSSGDELKLVFPQEGLDPETLAGLRFSHHLIQPMDGPEKMRNTELAVRYCLDHPRWRLSLQTHKWLGLP